MNTIKVLATEGDTIDLIVFGYCGSTSGGILEEVIELNPHLCDSPFTILTAGTPVYLPPLKKSSGMMVKKTIQLWD